MARSTSPTSNIRPLWDRLAPLPGGRWVFSRILGFMIPYSGSMGATVHALAAGEAEVVLQDRRSVRNHLGSVHAVALANLGELTTGLALVPSLPGSVRGIVTGLEVSYLKKARGTLRCRADVDVPDVAGPMEWTVEAGVTDREGDEVARVRAHWRLSPADHPSP